MIENGRVDKGIIRLLIISVWIVRWYLFFFRLGSFYIVIVVMRFVRNDMNWIFVIEISLVKFLYNFGEEVMWLVVEFIWYVLC